ncbi:MAG TPA: serine/threonine-protein kinase, partial [Planctomycetota bacterium]|nr:serine/threonine-protein kinase [Planctomycetota bacterium]
AHAKGIVHRDLKPENVLFDAEERPLVADLGLAKHFDEPGEASRRGLSLSQQGAFRGTAGYAPPEQASDAKSAGPASDVFALGAILHECLAGRPAFTAENLIALLSKMARGDHDVLGPGEAPEWLTAVIARALDPDPEARFADGAELLAALETRSGRRRRSHLPPALAVLGLVAGGAGVALLLARGSRDAAPAPAPPVPKAPPTDADRRRVREALATTGVVTSATAPWEVVRTAEDLGRAAADRGVVYALADVAEPSTPAVLRALALLGACKREEAEKILAASRPSGVAERIREALLAADALEVAAANVAGGKAFLDDDREPRRRMDELAATIPVLVREPAELVDTVLEPVARLARRLAADEMCNTGIGEPASFALAVVAKWSDRSFLERLSPRLVAPLLVVGEKRCLGILDGNDPGSAVEHAGRIASRLEASDPVLAAAALVSLLARYSPADNLERNHRVVAVARQTVGEVERLLARPHAPEDDEWARVVRFHALELLGMVVLTFGDPVHEDEALHAFRRALDLTIENVGKLKLRRGRAARDLAIVILARHPETLAPGDLDEDAFRLLDDRPVAAEVLRRQGRPKEALALLDAAALREIDGEKRWVPLFHGVRTLALLDLGQVEEARAEARELSSLPDETELGVHGVTVATVRARLARGR